MSEEPEFSDEFLKTVDVDYVQAALDGNENGIVLAFVWSGSVQGSNHWAAIDDGKPLTDDDRAYLIRLRDAALEREKAG